MRTRKVLIRVGLCVWAVTIAAGFAFLRSKSGEVPRTEPPARPAIGQSFGSLPLAFEPNQGQADGSAHFLARTRRANVFLTSRGAAFALKDRSTAGRSISPSPSFEFEWAGAAAAIPQGLDPLPGRVNYFIGNRPEGWRTHIPLFSRIQYTDLYPKVDLVYYGQQREMEFDLVVHPGGDPERIELTFHGADSAAVSERGDLLLSVNGRQVRILRPTAYQTRPNGARLEVPVEYAMLAPSRVGFRPGRYDPSLPLRIDPVVVFSTYLGGSENDDIAGVAVDSNGNVYVAGSTGSASFPTASPSQGTFGGLFDAFVAKLNSAGSALVYATYLGGSSGDYGYGLAIDGSGNAYVTGFTSSTNFPTAGPPLQRNLAGGSDAFVTKLNASGSALLYSTYLGGSSDDVAYGIAVDSSNNAYVAGETRSTNFPTASPFQGSIRGVSDAFVSKLNAAGSGLMYSTYLGGANQDGAKAIAVDSSGSAYVAGYTASSNFPTVSAFQPGPGGTSDGFATKLSPSGSTLVYSTYLGGNDQDFASGIAVDGLGQAYVVGQTFSANFPVLNPIQPALGGGSDGFVTALNASGNGLLYSTWLGGGGAEFLYGVAVDAAGKVSVVGETTSTNFPTAVPLQRPGGGTDAVVVQLADAGTSFVYSTYLGGSQDDSARGVAVDSTGNLYVVGRTTSTNFPVAAPFQQANAGRMDGFIAKIAPSTALQVSGIAPDAGPISGGTAVTISGANFSAPSVVTFGGLPATGINVASGGQITAQTPAHNAGVVDVVVQVPDGGPSSTLTGGFTYTAPPDTGAGGGHRGGCACAAADSSSPPGLSTILMCSVFLLAWAHRRFSRGPTSRSDSLGRER